MIPHCSVTEAHEQEQHREDGRLQVPADVAHPPEPGVAQPQGAAGQQQQRAQHHEHAEGLVHRVDAQDGGRAALQVLPGGRKRRDGRVSCARMGMCAMASFFLPAWMIDSSV